MIEDCMTMKSSTRFTLTSSLITDQGGKIKMAEKARLKTRHRRRFVCNAFILFSVFFNNYFFNPFSSFLYVEWRETQGLAVWQADALSERPSPLSLHPENSTACNSTFKTADQPNLKKINKSKKRVLSSLSASSKRHRDATQPKSCDQFNNLSVLR